MARLLRGTVYFLCGFLTLACLCGILAGSVGMVVNLLTEGRFLP